VFPLGFGLVDLIVPGLVPEQTRLRKLVGFCLAWPGDPMHRMNHMAGWLRGLSWRCRVGSGASPLCFWSSVSEGFSRELSAAGIPAVG
jgi:hypothetical protein